jgi:hypothetical protein
MATTFAPPPHAARRERSATAGRADGRDAARALPGLQARAARIRTVADAHARTAAARADLDTAIAEADRDCRRLAARLQEFDGRLCAVRQHLVGSSRPGGPARRARADRHRVR